jgi:hypothetical protein
MAVSSPPSTPNFHNSKRFQRYNRLIDHTLNVFQRRRTAGKASSSYSHPYLIMANSSKLSLIILLILFLLTLRQCSSSALSSSTCDMSSLLVCLGSSNGYNSYEVKYGSILPCFIYCRNHKLTNTTDSIYTFMYQVDHESVLDSSNYTSNNIGQIRDQTLSEDRSFIEFYYLAPLQGSAETIHIKLNTSQAQHPDIYNSPVYITLINPSSHDSPPFFSFSNSIFLIIFVLLLCVFFGISAVLIYTACERYQKHVQQQHRARLIDSDQANNPWALANTHSYGSASNITKIIDQTHQYDAADEKLPVLPAFLREQF